MKNYNYLTFLFVIITLLQVTKSLDLTPQERAKIAESNKSCLSSSGAKPEEIAQVRSGKFENSDKAPIHKYFSCMMRSLGVINQSGQLQTNVLKKKVPKDMKREEALTIFLTCKDKKGSNADETAYLLYKCFWEASPRHLSLDGQ